MWRGPSGGGLPPVQAPELFCLLGAGRVLSLRAQSRGLVRLWAVARRHLSVGVGPWVPAGQDCCSVCNGSGGCWATCSHWKIQCDQVHIRKHKAIQRTHLFLLVKRRYSGSFICFFVGRAIARTCTTRCRSA